jgi:hypothetical protein
VARQTLTVTSTTGGAVSSSLAGISCGTDCTEDYDHGTVVVLTATAAAGNSFTGWSGACSGTVATCSVTLDQARNAGATFAANPPSNNPGSGSSSSGGGGGGRLDFALLLAFAGLIAARLRRRFHEAILRESGLDPGNVHGGSGAGLRRLA